MGTTKCPGGMDYMLQLLLVTLTSTNTGVFATNTESQNHGMVWFVRDLGNPSHSNPLPWAETLSARPGAQSPVQTGLEHTGFQLINLCFPVCLLCLSNITLTIPTMRSISCTEDLGRTSDLKTILGQSILNLVPRPKPIGGCHGCIFQLSP